MRARSITTLVLGLWVVALLAPAAVNADIIAATSLITFTPNGHDIALVNTATGARLGLPAGIDTADDETHPSMSADGKRLVFERLDQAGVQHIIVVDLATGQQAQLFNAFESGQYQPTSPTITPDGQTVITGAIAQSVGNGKFVPTWIETSLANFPNAPFPHVVREMGDFQQAVAGATFEPTFDPSIGTHGITALVYDFRHQPPIPEAILVDGSGSDTHFSETFHVLDPFISGAAGVLLFTGSGGLDYRTLGADGFPNSSTFVLFGVNRSGPPRDPAVTADGRYVVYQATSGGHARVFVFDTTTQTVLNPDGADLGEGVSSDGMSLHEVFILKSTSFATFNRGLSPVVGFTLSTGSNVGILVQRIVGRHKVFGRRVFKLRTVGRVPFGHFRRGKHRVRWNLKVNGHKLRRGMYLITPRALTRTARVRDLGKSYVLRVR